MGYIYVCMVVTVYLTQARFDCFYIQTQQVIHDYYIELLVFWTNTLLLLFFLLCWQLLTR